MSYSLGNLSAFLRKAVFYQRCSQYVNVASLALLAIDYLQTLPDEVSLVWPREWSIVKSLFLVSRYLPFAYAPLTVWVGLQKGASLESCAMAFGASAVLIVVNMLVAEAIMLVRLYALSGQNKKMLAWIILQLVGVQATVLTIFSLWIKSVQFIPSPLPNVPGCIPYRFNSENLLIVFGTVMASQLAIMLLSSWTAFRNYRFSGSPLLRVFYQDGLFYFVSLTVVTVGNIIFHEVGPGELRFMLALPQGALHSILSCHLILHIYTFSRPRIPGQDTNGMKLEPEIRFARPPKFSDSWTMESGHASLTATTMSRVTPTTMSTHGRGTPTVLTASASTPRGASPYGFGTRWKHDERQVKHYLNWEWDFGTFRFDEFGYYGGKRDTDSDSGSTNES